MNRSLQWKLVAGFVLVFIAGTMSGFFFASMHARRMFAEFHQPNLVAARMKARLQTELSLTPEQMAAISPIIDKSAAQLEQIRVESGRRVHQTFMDSHREMSTHLTEEQRKKLDEMQQRHRPFHMMHGGPHGPPPPGGDEGPPP
jgi:hypothetical protein